MIWIGIDPGLKGALAALDSDGRLLWAERTPLMVGEYDLAEMVHLLEKPDGPPSWTLVALEDVSAARVGGKQQGSTSMFTFGEGKGIWKGIIAALGFARIDVRPQAWSKALLGGMPREEDPVKRVLQRKMNAVVRAKQFWPAIPIKFKADWGMADAALIAEYARRQHAGKLIA